MFTLLGDINTCLKAFLKVEILSLQSVESLYLSIVKKIKISIKF
jgi:hypothetical protein